ncbi:hypothetical protein AAG570_002165 [Ranatra chinensis]|uniref:N-acetyltransferase domain-containing protein n=1 Tax=Ranatra chinensis TaxID=642074 RepID=A0ABD0Y755_9HEMI
MDLIPEWNPEENIMMETEVRKKSTENMSLNVVIRNAKREDCPEISRLTKELASYLQKPGEVEMTVEDLEQNGFCIKSPLYKSLVVEDPAETGEVFNSDGSTDLPRKLIGVAVFYYGFSTWKGKILYLENFIISEKYRGNGLGEALFRQVCQVAKEEDCKTLEFIAINGTRAINFYRRFRAKDMTLLHNGHLYMIDRKDFT